MKVYKIRFTNIPIGYLQKDLNIRAEDEVDLSFILKDFNINDYSHIINEWKYRDKYYKTRHSPLKYIIIDEK
jgi:hypothetical protein